MRNVLLDLKQRNVHVILMSDANTFYIDTILKVTSNNLFFKNYLTQV